MKPLVELAGDWFYGGAAVSGLLMLFRCLVGELIEADWSATVSWLLLVVSVELMLLVMVAPGCWRLLRWRELHQIVYRQSGCCLFGDGGSWFADWLKLVFDNLLFSFFLSRGLLHEFPSSSFFFCYRFRSSLLTAALLDLVRFLGCWLLRFATADGRFRLLRFSAPFREG